MTEENTERKFPKIKHLNFNPPGIKFSASEPGTEVERVVAIVPHPLPRAEEGQAEPEPLLPFHRFNLHWYRDPSGRDLPLKTNGLPINKKGYDDLFNPPADNILMQSINLLFREGKKRGDIGRHIYPNGKAVFQVIPMVQNPSGDFVADIEAITHQIPESDETTLRPLLFEVSGSVYREINNVTKKKAERSKVSQLDYFNGPNGLVTFSITAIKTGTLAKDVEYKTMMEDNRTELTDEVAEVMNNRYFLPSLYRQATAEDQLRILRLHQFPIPDAYKTADAVAPTTGEIPVPSFNTEVPNQAPSEDAEALQAQLANNTAPY